MNVLDFAYLFDEFCDTEETSGLGIVAEQSMNKAIVGCQDETLIEEFAEENDLMAEQLEDGSIVMTMFDEETGDVTNQFIFRKIEKDLIAEEITKCTLQEEPDYVAYEIELQPVAEHNDVISLVSEKKLSEAKAKLEKMIEAAVIEKGYEFDNTFENIIGEASRFKIKVNSRGKKTRKLRCRPGFKVVGGRKCVRMKSAEKLHRKRGLKKAKRTKKAKGKGALKRAIFKRKRALKKRSSMGIH